MKAGEHKKMTIIFETQRLIAKAPQESDVEYLYSLQSDSEVMKLIGKGVPRSKEKIQASLKEIIEYYKKHGFSFFSIFEKETNEFVGQAGLFHLNFDDSQEEIEVGYRLNKKFWNKGFATELAKGLIKWGFEHIKVNKFVAFIKSENDRSRKVLQKLGMRYIGKSAYAHFAVDKFEIAKNTIDYSKLKLIPASIDDHPIIQNMGRFYVYDMSEFLGDEDGWAMPEDGLYECIDFKKYWQTENAFPFLVKYSDELVGFVIVDKKGSDAKIDFNMAQFFILRKFKGKGVGRYVAYQCFKQFPGVWEVMIIPGNEGAYRFWRKIISEYTTVFEEYTKTIAHFNDSVKNIFKFKSQGLDVKMRLIQ